MNRPNKLTLSRLVLTVLFLLFIFSNIRFHESMALAFFVIASLTDFWDGKIARRDGLITNFGILMDPLADKILTCSAFIAFVGLDLMPAWMAVVIVARELAITGLRLLAAGRNLVLAAEGFGKHKTISQMVSIIANLIALSYEQWGIVGKGVFGWTIAGKAWVDWLADISVWAAVFLTFMSGFLYLWKNRTLYLEDL
jgi:CDP-diacylglycerol--glycerol-3-phosphate 3-phosphatidyltransferase